MQIATLHSVPSSHGVFSVRMLGFGRGGEPVSSYGAAPGGFEETPPTWRRHSVLLRAWETGRGGAETKPCCCRYDDDGASLMDGGGVG